MWNKYLENRAALMKRSQDITVHKTKLKEIQTCGARIDNSFPYSRTTRVRILRSRNAFN